MNSYEIDKVLLALILIQSAITIGGAAYCVHFVRLTRKAMEAKDKQIESLQYLLADYQKACNW